MPNHKFLNTNFGNGFQTENAILNTPYKPEVLIVGTFNPDIPGNFADFFYGRNYFWRVFENLSNNNNVLNGPRIARNKIRLPNLNKILWLCQHFKITFADLILGTLPNVPINDFKDGYLNILGLNNELIENSGNIVNYINDNESIQHVYFTTKAQNLHYILGIWHNITNNCNRPLTFGSIISPSGQGLGTNLPGLHKAGTMARNWVWCNSPNAPLNRQIIKEGFTHLNHEWLLNHGVGVNLF